MYIFCWRTAKRTNPDPEPAFFAVDIPNIEIPDSRHKTAGVAFFIIEINLENRIGNSPGFNVP
jgi:hypothetical protein